MTVNFQKSLRGLVLVALGVLALYVGPKSLVLLVPAAGVIWWSAGPKLRSGRN